MQKEKKKFVETLSSERQKGEDFDEYKARRAVHNKLIKYWLKGRLFWNSVEKKSYINIKK